MIALLLAFVSLSGCTPTCDQSCRKLVRCDVIDADAVTEDLCSEDCAQLEALYVAWDDQQLVDDLHASRECIDASTCEEIADGVCYEQDLYPY